MPPPLLELGNRRAYRAHYQATYCAEPVIAHDEIPVLFKPGAFWHAFMESSMRNRRKDKFSTVRATRMERIQATLTNPASTRYQGHDRDEGKYNPTRRVEHTHENFVVVLQLTLMRRGDLNAEFVTCHQADNSIGKIQGSPLWNRNACVEALER